MGGVSVGLTSSQEEEDVDDNEEDDASVINDLSELNNGSLVSEGMEGQRFLPDVPIDKSKSTSMNHDDSPVTADANGQRFLPDASAPHTSGQLASERPGHRHP